MASASYRLAIEEREQGQVESSSGPKFHYRLKRLLICLSCFPYSAWRWKESEARASDIEQKWRICSLLYNCTAPSDIEIDLCAPSA